MVADREPDLLGGGPEHRQVPAHHGLAVDARGLDAEVHGRRHRLVRPAHRHRQRAQPDLQLLVHERIALGARVNALLDDAVAKGARIVTGGKATSTLMPPTIVDGVERGMRIYSEESFGPVVAAIRTSGVEEAVRSANDTE